MYQDPFEISSPGKLIGLQFFLKLVKPDDSILTVTPGSSDTSGDVTVDNAQVNVTVETNEDGEEFPPGRVISVDVDVAADSELEVVDIYIDYTTTLSGGERLRVTHPLRIKPYLTQ